MDDIVVDSSTAIKWFVVESYSTESRRVLSDYQSGAINLLAPDLFFAEIGSILWKKRRFQGMSAADAQQTLDALLAIPFKLTSSRLDPRRVSTRSFASTHGL